MLAKVVKQTSWSMLGSIFGFAVGFFVKMYLIRAVGTDAFGKYMIGQTVVSTVQVFIALAIPQLLLRYLPALLEKNEGKKANNLASFGLQYLIMAGILSAIVIIIFHQQIMSIFHDGDNYLGYLIMLSAFYVPFALYMGAINTAYRSLLQIKEIVLYGTVWMVSIRAILTFIVFSFTNDIVYFILIELFSMLVVLSIMTLKFDRTRLSFMIPFPYKKILKEKPIVAFGKKMYFYSLIGFVGGYGITLVMSMTLPASDIGIYTILTTIAGLSAFLLTNLNSVFAPLISKFHAAGEMHRLELLFKDSTFIVNIMTAPFIVLLVFFSKDVLSLYGNEVAAYGIPLIILVFGSYINLFVGNSGMLLLMGGRENDEIYIKIANIVFVLASSVLLIPKFGLLAAVWINTASLIGVNLIHAYFVKKRFGFTPWDAGSAVLFVITVSTIGYVGWFHPSFNFGISGYLWTSIVTLMIFWLPFTSKINRIIQSIRDER